MEMKTQTRRTTKQIYNLINFNCFIEKGFEIGVVSSKYWGDFDNREDPLIEIEVEGVNYNLPLIEFKKFVKIQLKKFKNRDYTKDKQ